MPRPEQDFLGTHFQDGVWMSADPNTSRRHLPQQRVEHGPRLSIREGIHPNEDAIEREKPIANVILKIFGIDDRFRVYADLCERREDAMKSIVCWRNSAFHRVVAAPQKSNFSRFNRHPGSPATDRSSFRAAREIPQHAHKTACCEYRDHSNLEAKDRYHCGER